MASRKRQGYCQADFWLSDSPSTSSAAALLGRQRVIPSSRSAGSSAGPPSRLPRGLGKPLDRFHHRSDGPSHMREVDAADFVAGLMVVGMQPKAGNGLGNDSPPGKAVVVRTLKKFLRRVRIGDQAGAMAHKLRAQVAPLETGEPKTVPRQSRVADGRSFQTPDWQRSGRGAPADGQESIDSHNLRFLRNRRGRRAGCGRGGDAPAKTRASSITAVVPEASSSAPL